MALRPSACLLVWVALAGAPGSGAAASPPRADEIDAWIGQLSSPQYARREAAARDLVAAGAAALPGLERVIRADDPEASARGVEIVTAMISATDTVTAAAAERCLAALAAADDGHHAARLAADAYAFHSLAVAAAARERLEALGAVIRERHAIDGGGLDVSIDASWKGRPEDFRELARVRGVVVVSVRGVPVDAGMLDVLGGLGGLQRLDLFGTGAGPEQARQLAARLPAARLDVRVGGRLGVTSVALAGPCEIRTVEPGSAADQAGLRSGDVVVSIEDDAVAGFEELMERIGRRAPGDAVRLVVARPGVTPDADPERIEFQVRLDAW
ncbi:MAG: PDZ domain-containing protein [Planctomycetes bacterium]|nr:PDZ domain-containing protein [Planctomycetota bacterium]